MECRVPTISVEEPVLGSCARPEGFPGTLPAHAQAQWCGNVAVRTFLGVSDKNQLKTAGAKRRGSQPIYPVRYRSRGGCGWACAQGQGGEPGGPPPQLSSLGWVPLILQAGPCEGVEEEHQQFVPS